MAEFDKQIDVPLEVVVLAAGQGTRMRSAHPKVLHGLAGRSLLEHVLTTVAALQPRQTHVVVGYQAVEVRTAIDAAMPEANLCWVEQSEQRGTGHAVQQALPAIGDDATVLVVYGDVPLVTLETLTGCVEVANRGHLGLVTAEFAEPAELGRIVRNAAGGIREIVEYADADADQRQIGEINSGILALNAAQMKTLLGDLQADNAQGEYYLTDLITLAVRSNVAVEGLSAQSPEEVAGVNDRLQLAQLERHYQAREAERLMRSGVTLADPARLDIRGAVVAGEDCFIDINVVLEGQVRLGQRVSIGPGVVIKDTEFGDDVRVEAHTVIEGATVAAGCRLGPFARIRPGTELAEGVKIGNFVETKKARLGRGTKASHLSYLGDATLGEGCNVGAGTVTCNYDGIDKHHTHIGDNVFVGTNSTLVAPLEIGADSFVAAGSTITSKVGPRELAVSRGRQRNIEGWKRPVDRTSQRPVDRTEPPAKMQPDTTDGES
jgi:bifunctional UDP-N-acetylglucosamine pyrophosphorylase/glucosamine-1-phosphate N-acetyltransferase